MENKKSILAPWAEAELVSRQNGSPTSGCSKTEEQAAARQVGDSDEPGEESGARGSPGNGYLCIAPDVKFGMNVRLSRFINLYGCEVGDETKIGTFVEIRKNANGRGQRVLMSDPERH